MQLLSRNPAAGLSAGSSLTPGSRHRARPTSPASVLEEAAAALGQALGSRSTGRPAKCRAKALARAQTITVLAGPLRSRRTTHCAKNCLVTFFYGGLASSRLNPGANFARAEGGGNRPRA